MFRRLGLSILAVTAAVALSACNGGTKQNTVAEGKEGKETVRILIPGLSERATMDPVSGLRTEGLSAFQEFLNEQIPDYNIQVVTIAWDGWIQSMEAMLTAGEADVGVFTNQEAVPDWYLDLTPYLENDPEVNFDNLDEWFIEPAVYYMKYKSFNHPDQTGKIFGLPSTIACTMITYDSQLFEEWGVEEPNEEMSFSELVDLSEKMTGTNPVTGKKNYGAFVHSTWPEWYSLCYGVGQPLFSDTMDVNTVDWEKYVESINTRPEVRKWFTDLICLVDTCTEGVATGDGAKNWLTDSNDTAMNFDVSNKTKEYMQFVYAGDTQITDRYKAIMIPEGPNGEGFPEFYRWAVNKNASNPDAAWEVVKVLCTDKEIINEYLMNYQRDKLPCLVDYSGMPIMDYEINQKRLEYQTKNLFITDDYWYWRTAMQIVDNQILSKQYTPDQALTAYYDAVSSWFENVKKQVAK